MAYECRAGAEPGGGHRRAERIGPGVRPSPKPDAPSTPWRVPSTCGGPSIAWRIHRDPWVAGGDCRAAVP